VASSSIHEERPVLKTAIVREWLYAVSGLMAGFVFTALTQPHDYATGWLTLLAPYVVFQSIRWSVRTAKETLIKLSFSKANAATVSADEAEDTGDDEWL
jgi:hypothetical protein